MAAPPFLTINDRVAYLYERGYFEPGSMTDDDVDRLSNMNFHYFLGYGREYRALVRSGDFFLPNPYPHDVFRVIEIDGQMTGLLHEGLRTAEWRLRAALVEAYCSSYDPAGSFLDPEQYRDTGYDNRNRIVGEVLHSIYRHDEPYVVRHLTDAFTRDGLAEPDGYDHYQHQLYRDKANDLPLWSVVDSFSFGLLIRFIMECDTDQRDPVWKQVARTIGIEARVFPNQMEALTYLRNLVAHHARLWMRPTEESPRQPTVFADRLEDSDPESMYWAFMNLASFMPEYNREDFADRVDGLANQSDLYHHGIWFPHGLPY